MKIVTYRSLAQRKERLGIWIVLACLIVAGVLWLFSKQANADVGLYLILGSFLAVAMAVNAVKAFQSWSDGDTGECKAINNLKSLSDEYTAVRNWVVPGTEQGDIDLMVLGPHGVLVCEVKNYGARYECDGDNWVNVKENGYRKKMKSPSRQLKRNVKAVARYLDSLNWKGDLRGVLVVRPRADLRLANPTVEVVDWRALPGYVAALPRSSRRIEASVFHLDPAVLAEMEGRSRAREAERFTANVKRELWNVMMRLVGAAAACLVLWLTYQIWLKDAVPRMIGDMTKTPVSPGKDKAAIHQRN